MHFKITLNKTKRITLTKSKPRKQNTNQNPCDKGTVNCSPAVLPTTKPPPSQSESIHLSHLDNRVNYQTVPIQPAMATHGLTPYVTLTFRDTQDHYQRTNQRIALISTSSPQSTMEESTYKNLFPTYYAADEDPIPSPLVLNDPHKEYTLISRKLFQCNFYMSTQNTEIPIQTKFHIISDPNRRPPDIVLGADILLDPLYVNSLTPNGIRMADDSLVPYQYITKTLSPKRSISYRMNSPTSAKIRTLPVNPFHHQAPQTRFQNPIESPTDHTEQESTASPNHQSQSPDQYHYGRTNLNN